jgi:hypothetical protein
MPVNCLLDMVPRIRVRSGLKTTGMKDYTSPTDQLFIRGQLQKLVQSSYIWTIHVRTGHRSRFG